MNGRLWSTQAFVASRKQWVRLVYLTIITTLQGLLNISKCGLNPHLPSLCTHALPLLLDLAPVMWFCEMTGSTFSHTVNLIHTLQYITVGIYTVWPPPICLQMSEYRRKRSKNLQGSSFVNDNVHVLTLWKSNIWQSCLTSTPSNLTVWGQSRSSFYTANSQWQRQ